MNLNEYLKKYIEISRQFRAKERTQKTAEPLHELAAQLSKLPPSPKIKLILADIYSLLGYHKTAHEIFAEIANQADRKDAARLFKMKELAASHADTFAIKPVLKDETPHNYKLPNFKYCPCPMEKGIFRDDRIIECNCCGRETPVYYDGPFYTAADNVRYLCPECIHSGKAAKKYDASFQQNLVNDETIKDEGATDEILHRTPGYVSFQGNAWPAHCDDYCAFSSYVGWPELEERGIADSVENISELGFDALKDMRNNGSLQGYLFQCLKCKTHVILADMD
ncbi:uncharacterized protein CbrC (UPF0167 family) [Ereboglobus sp. PH5-10]|nr:uncharacterized protein CbrC (UPF0167 family) [Ereboglobus sp. PH5-10]